MCWHNLPLDSGNLCLGICHLAYRNEIITENSLRLKSVSKCEANEA